MVLLELNFCQHSQLYKTWICLCSSFSKITSTSGGVILAADYSQLELRVLAHLSRDNRLIQVLNSGADVFRSIAAEWKMTEPESVGEELRQQAKQVISVNMLNISVNFNDSKNYLRHLQLKTDFFFASFKLHLSGLLYPTAPPASLLSSNCSPLLLA